MGASGSATNTSRAASRIFLSLRAASARRPLNGVESLASMLAIILWNELFCSAMIRNRMFRSVNLWSGPVEEGVGCVGREQTGRIRCRDSAGARELSYGHAVDHLEGHGPTNRFR